MSSTQPHPTFDDGGTLHWHRELRYALEDAVESNKYLFIDVGREACSQCRTLVERTVPHPEIAPLLREHFVALASDVDDPEDEVLELAQEIPDAYMLPFVIFTDAEGRMLHGTSGDVNPAEFKTTLERLVAGR